MKTILIIEDQPDVRDLVRMTLEMKNYSVQEAADGERGLLAAANLQPDVVLLDLLMPGALNGLAVCQRIKADPHLKRTAVVILTGRTEPGVREAALQAGADDFLIKPFSPRQLLQVVQRLA
jgi:two-component system, OmpR family, phosphate regulon response regulator PhoB